jgi:hypothetical protein
VPFRRLLRIDWDVIAGISAALVAMLLSFMGLASQTVGVGIILLLCALLLTRDLRAEAREQKMVDTLDVIRRHVAGLAAATHADVRLVGPKRMRHEFTEFAATVCGDVRWFNVCCRMFHRPEIFDATLRVLLENHNVTSVTLLCRPDERRSWEADVVPKLRRCGHAAKLAPPLWRPIRGSVSVVLGDVDGDGRNEALVAILDEPFATTSQSPSVPRFTFHISSQSDLIVPIEEMIRQATTDFAADAVGEAPAPMPPGERSPR